MIETINSWQTCELISFKNLVAREKNSIDWFRAGLEADQFKLNSALAMEKLELARRDINSQIATRSAAYTGAGTGAAGGGGGTALGGFGYSQGYSRSGSTTGSPSLSLNTYPNFIGGQPKQAPFSGPSLSLQPRTN